MRILLISALALGACLMVDAPASGEEAPRAIQIKCELYEFRANRGKTLRSRPQVQTIDGQPAIVEVGSRVRLEIEGERKLDVQNGMRCQFTPHCLQRGGVKFDLEFDVTTPVDDDDDGVVAHKSGVRVVRSVGWGERVVVPLRNAAGETTHSIELVVTEVANMPRADDIADEVPPAPWAPAAFALPMGAELFRPARLPGSIP